MRKEIVWVIAIGVFIGLIVAFGFYRINSSVTPNNKNSQSESSPNPGPSEFKITLDKPDNDDVVTTTPLTVSGITKSLAWITVSGEKGDYILQADDTGVFSQDIDLVSGVNQIKVTAFDPAGAESVQKVLVVYSSSFQLNTVPSPAGSESDTTGSAIRQKVAQKVSEAMNKPKAYIGTVTDIADSTIQIKAQNSEIQQISTSNDGITVVSSKGTVTKNVKLTDIAIGDFVVAMGYVNSNSVLLAQRILVVDPIDEPKVESVFGKVSDVSKKDLTITGETPEPDMAAVTRVVPDKNTDFMQIIDGKATNIKFGSIANGDTVIFVRDNTKDTPTIRAIFVVQKSQS